VENTYHKSQFDRPFNIISDIIRKKACIVCFSFQHIEEDADPNTMKKRHYLNKNALISMG
jgi:hypothetical protein